MKTISLIIPCLNEAAQIPLTLSALDRDLPDGYLYEYVFVDDGSNDGSGELLLAACAKRERMHVIRFSRNFGKEAAIMAALQAAVGDAAILLDCDLQFPLSSIPQMLSAWQAGALIVEGYKKVRQKEAWGSRLNAAVFYKLFRLTSGFDLTNACDFMLLDRQVIDSYIQLPEQDLFFRALSRWVGFPRTRFEFEVQDRQTGQSKWSLKALLKLSLDALTGFSARPLLLVAALGLFLELIFLLLGLQTFIHWLRGYAADGFTTVILLQLLIGGFILLSLGLIGLYLSRLFQEAKGRPRYIIWEERSSADCQRKV